MKKKLIIILISLIIVLAILCFVKYNLKNRNDIELENDGSSKVDIVYKDITFSQINLKYEDGITTLTALMNNNDKESKNFDIVIYLKNDDGVKSLELEHTIENLIHNQKQLLQVGIVGDFSHIKNVEFEIKNKS